jgi:hypothetical protein
MRDSHGSSPVRIIHHSCVITSQELAFPKPSTISTKFMLYRFRDVGSTCLSYADDSTKSKNEPELFIDFHACLSMHTLNLNLCLIESYYGAGKGARYLCRLWKTRVRIVQYSAIVCKEEIERT